MDRERLREKYYGDVAEGYDAAREGTPLWTYQQQAVEGYLDRFPTGTRVLDVPVGSGRFLEAYQERSFDVVGVDASPDMLDRARTRATEANLREGDIFQLEFPDASFDVVVCVRLFNWLAHDDFQRAFSEVARVAKGSVVANVKTLIPWRELNAAQTLRQIKCRLGLYHDSPGIVLHEQRLVDDLIQRHGLTSEDRTLTDAGPDGRRGIQNQMYLMRK